MFAPDPLPTYLYKILPSPPPSPLPTTLPLSALDAADGFIHLSTPAQIPATCSAFFADRDELYLLKMSLAELRRRRPADPLVWERVDGRPDAFPHLYAGAIGREDVLEVIVLARARHQSWDEAARAVLEQ